MIPKAEWYWASNIYRNVYKFEWRKRRKNFLLHHLVRISLLDDAFSKILERTGNWQKQEKKEKRKKKQKSLKRLSSTFGHAWSIGERKAILAEIHLERLSTVSRPSVDWLLSESRPTIDRLSTAISTTISTKCWPTIDRYIDRQIGQHYLQ